MQKSIINIQLDQMPIKSSCNSQYSPNSDKLHNWTKSFVVIQTLLLSVPFCYQSSLKPFNTPISSIFDFIDPFATYRNLTNWQRYKLSSIVYFKCLYLIKHGCLPPRISCNLSIGLGLNTNRESNSESSMRGR